MRSCVLIGIVMMAVALLADPSAAQAHEVPGLEETFVQGVFSPKFTPPAAGTYDLPVIKRVPAFVLIDATGRRTSTHALMQGKVAVVSFFYTTCSDRLGCPLAGMALRALQALLRREGLQGQAVLLSISLDAERDTPAQLAQYAQRFGVQPSLWHLLTAPSEQALQAALDSYGQDRAKVYDEQGRFTGRYRHVLKVFLVDQAGDVRNIYSAGTLVPRVMVNDIKTLLAEKTVGRGQVR